MEPSVLAECFSGTKSPKCTRIKCGRDLNCANYTQLHYDDLQPAAQTFHYQTSSWALGLRLDQCACPCACACVKYHMGLIVTISVCCICVLCIGDAVFCFYFRYHRFIYESVISIAENINQLFVNNIIILPVSKASQLKVHLVDS